MVSYPERSSSNSVKNYVTAPEHVVTLLELIPVGPIVRDDMDIVILLIKGFLIRWVDFNGSGVILDS